MKKKLSQQRLKEIFQPLKTANNNHRKIYPDLLKNQQPLHTVYGGAHLFKSNLVEKLGNTAKKIFLTYAPDPVTFSQTLQLKGWNKLPENPAGKEWLLEQLPENYEPSWLAETVWSRVLKKLDQEPVEDFRIDFEDGFGVRDDKEEDEVAFEAAREVAKGMQAKSLPKFIGIRIKDFDHFYERAISTLDIFLSSLLEKTNNQLPNNFVVTLPKVFIPEQVHCLVQVFEDLEKIHSLEPNVLKMEIMIELTQSIINAKGKTAIWDLIQAAKGRCRGLHFGTYDYTASCGIVASHQKMDSPVCDFAKHIMQTTVTGTDIMLSDGSTNIFPVPVYPDPQNPVEIHENLKNVHTAWKLQFDHINHSLESGFYQGWDLHPGQIPIRYAACYSFYLSAFQEISQRMKNFLEMSGKALLSVNVFDDAATGQGLINFFLKAYACKAIIRAEIEEIGITPEILQTKSFPKIIAEYKKNANN